MVNELNFTIFKSSLLESLKGLCEHDTDFIEVWWSVCTQNKTLQWPPPSSKRRFSPERLFEILMGREASFDPERSNKTSGCRAKAMDVEVDPSL